jgi:hypothetical protein
LSFFDSRIQDFGCKNRRLFPEKHPIGVAVGFGDVKAGLPTGKQENSVGTVQN